MPRLDGVEHRGQRDRARDVDLDLPVDAREPAQMGRQSDPDAHGSAHHTVCTSTESTGGRSRTIGAHESPESLDA